MASRRPLDGQAIYVISVAAELAGVHPQTLRIYERKGLLQPQRTAGNTRRYSEQDIATLRRIQELTGEGINLAGVLRIMALEVEVDRLRAGQMRAANEARDAELRLIEVLAERDAVAMVPLKDVRRMRRAMKSDALDEASRRRIFPSPPGDVL